MKIALTTALLMFSTLALAEVSSTVEDFKVSCSIKQVRQEADGSLVPYVRDNIYLMSKITSRDQMEFTTIWKDVSDAINGVPLDVSESNGMEIGKLTKISENEFSYQLKEIVEYLDINERWVRPEILSAGTITTTFKDEKRTTELYLTTVYNGVEMQDQNLRNKIMLNEKDYTVDMFWLNPEASTDTSSKVISSHKFCTYLAQ